MKSWRDRECRPPLLSVQHDLSAPIAKAHISGRDRSIICYNLSNTICTKCAQFIGHNLGHYAPDQLLLFSLYIEHACIHLPTDRRASTNTEPKKRMQNSNIYHTKQICQVVHSSASNWFIRTQCVRRLHTGALASRHRAAAVFKQIAYEMLCWFPLARPARNRNVGSSWCAPPPPPPPVRSAVVVASRWLIAAVARRAPCILRRAITRKVTCTLRCVFFVLLFV